jgi:hypothetical protein
MPADAVPGLTIPEDTDAEILLGDGSWVWAQVIGQRKDRYGRWCIGLRSRAAQGCPALAAGLGRADYLNW